MYCTQCGALVPEGASSCTQCGSAVSSSSVVPQSAEATVTRRPAVAIRIVRAMNIVGAIGTCLEAVGVVAYASGVVQTPELVFFIFVYIVLVAVAMTSFFALSNGAGRVVQQIALALNLGLITLWGAIVFWKSSMPTLSTNIVLWSALFLVVPEWINAWTLRKLLKAGKGSVAGVV